MIVGGESMAKGTIKTKKYKIKRVEDIDETEDPEEEEQEPVSNYSPVISALKVIGIIFIIASVFHSAVINRIWNLPVQATSLISGESYTVKQGDTLWLIAKRKYKNANLGDKIREIKEMNNLKGDGVRAGQVLRLP
jgi:nucleoid-associated protein YgaU